MHFILLCTVTTTLSRSRSATYITSAYVPWPCRSEGKYWMSLIMPSLSFWFAFIFHNRMNMHCHRKIFGFTCKHVFCVVGNYRCEVSLVHALFIIDSSSVWYLDIEEIFSSPEPKARVSYCHSAPSVRPSLSSVRKLFTFSTSSQKPLDGF